MLLVLGFVFKHVDLYCFWKIWVVLRRTYKFYSSGLEKDQLSTSAGGLLLLLLWLG